MHRLWAGKQLVKTNGQPLEQGELRAHINFLELKAALLALNEVLYWEQISYACRFDGHHSNIFHKPQGRHLLQAFVRSGCADMDMVYPEDITVCAVHVPGIDNMGAGRDSRKHLGLAEWKLNGQLFLKIKAKWGPLDVDLFAAKHNQL